MTKNQIYNLVNFSLLFHHNNQESCLMNSDLEYIWEKYIKMIGVEPVVKPTFGRDFWQTVPLPNTNALSVKLMWYNKWIKSGKMDPKKEQVINYLSLTNSLDLVDIGITGMLHEFERCVGSKEMISDDLYGHLHPIFKNHVEHFFELTRRDYNLCLLV